MQKCIDNYLEANTMFTILVRDHFYVKKSEKEEAVSVCFFSSFFAAVRCDSLVVSVLFAGRCSF